MTRNDGGNHDLMDAFDESAGEEGATGRSHDVDPIVIADGGETCEYCSTVFDPDGVASTAIPSTVLLRCPVCGRWTAEG